MTLGVVAQFRKQQKLLKDVAVGTIFTPEQAKKEFDIDISPGWQVKVEGFNPTTGMTSFTQITPEGWQIKPDDTFVSPAGESLRRQDLEVRRAEDIKRQDIQVTEGARLQDIITRLEPFKTPEGLFDLALARGTLSAEELALVFGEEAVPTIEQSDYALLYQNYQRTGGVLDYQTWFFAGSPLIPSPESEVTLPLEEQIAQYETAIGAVFPGFDIEDYNFMIEEHPEEFERRMLEGGLTKEKNNLLRVLGYSQEEIDAFYGATGIPPEIVAPPLTEKEAKVAYDQKIKAIGVKYPRGEASFGWWTASQRAEPWYGEMMDEQARAWDDYQASLLGFEKSLVGRVFIPSTEGFTPGEMPSATWLDRVRELSDTPGELIPFVGSSMEAGYIATLLSTANKLEAGEEVGKDELLALYQYVERSQRDKSWGFKVADIVANMIPWGLEFLLTGGVFTAGKAAGVKAGTLALKRFATKAGLKTLKGLLKRYGIKITGIVAGGTLRSIPIGLTKVPAATLEKQLQTTLVGDEESVWMSLVKSVGENWVETVSESAGELFAPLGVVIKGQLVKSGVFKAFLRANPTKRASDINKIMGKLGYNGIFGEMLEERIADVGHGILAALGLGDQEFSIPSWEQLGIELAAFSVPAVAARVIETIPPGAIPGMAGVLPPEIPEEGELPATPEVIQLKGLGWSDSRIAELDAGERASIIRNNITPESAKEITPPITPEVPAVPEVIRGTEPGGIKTLSIKDKSGEVISSLAFTEAKDSIILDSMGTVGTAQQQGLQTRLWEELSLTGKPIETRAGTLTDAGERFIQSLGNKGFNVVKTTTPEGMTQYTITKPPAVEVAPPVTPTVTPTEAPVTEPVVPAEVEVPIEADNSGIVPTDPIDEVASDAVPIINEITVIERGRPTRKVFDKMGIYEIWEAAFEAETLKTEELTRFNKIKKQHAKAVGKDSARRELIWEYVNNSKAELYKQMTFEEKRAAKWFKSFADSWADRLGIPASRRIKNYISHIFDEQAKVDKDIPVNAAMAQMLDEKVREKVPMPFLKQRLGKEFGLIKDPFMAATAYENMALKIFYYQPLLEKIKLIAEHETTPEFAGKYLKDFSRRLTGEPATIDREINEFINQIANSPSFTKIIRPIPKIGDFFYKSLTQGNPSAMSAYNLTSAMYVMWLGFKPTSAIRNLSQQGLAMAEAGPVAFAEGYAKTLTAESKQAASESLVIRSRRGAFVESIDSTMIEGLPAKFRESALFLFRQADALNVRQAFLAGYYEAKRLYPDVDRSVWVKRGDEVAMDTQYLYTKLNSIAISQSGPGKIGAMLTTWAINYSELINKWVQGKQSRVYSEAGLKMPAQNWLARRKSLLTYLAIIGLLYALKEQDWNRVKVWEYSGLTSLRTFANLAGGEFPALELPGAVADIVAGAVLGDDRMLNTGWNKIKRSVSVLNQLESVAGGEKDWATLLFYLKAQNFRITELKEDWEDSFQPYEDLADPIVRARSKEYATLSRTQAQNKYREENPLEEAKMFVVGQFTTLSSDEARAEVLRLIEEHDLNPDNVTGYAKIFQADIKAELQGFEDRVGNLEKLTIGEDAEYFKTSNYESEVNRLVKKHGKVAVASSASPLTLFILDEQTAWQLYDDTSEEGRRLLRQQTPELEASLYLFGKVTAFQTPESAKILLQLMAQHGIKPESVQAFIDNPEKYDNLFSPRFKLVQATFELDTLSKNYSNSESEVYIEDEEARNKARAKLRGDNPEWVANLRRIDAMDKDATPEITEGWVYRGALVDEFGGSSSEVKVWLIDNPDVHQWALDNELLTDDGSGWNENVLRLHSKWREQNEVYAGFGDKDASNYIQNDKDRIEARKNYLKDNPEYNDDRRRRDMYSLNAPDNIVEEYVEYGGVVDEFGSNSAEANLFRLEHPTLSTFGEKEGNLDWEAIDKSREPIWQIDVQWATQDEEYQAILDTNEGTAEAEATKAYLFPGGEATEYATARYTRQSYQEDVPEGYRQDYITWFTDLSITEKPEDYPTGIANWEDNWWMLEHMGFHNEVWMKLLDNQSYPIELRTKDGVQYLIGAEGKPSKTPPTRELGAKRLEFIRISRGDVQYTDPNTGLVYDSKGQGADQYRIDNSDMDEWGVAVGIWATTMTEKRKQLGETPGERAEREAQELIDWFKEQQERLREEALR